MLAAGTVTRRRRLPCFVRTVYVYTRVEPIVFTERPPGRGLSAVQVRSFTFSARAAAAVVEPRLPLRRSDASLRLWNVAARASTVRVAALRADRAVAAAAARTASTPSSSSGARTCVDRRRGVPRVDSVDES